MPEYSIEFGLDCLREKLKKAEDMAIREKAQRRLTLKIIEAIFHKQDHGMRAGGFKILQECANLLEITPLKITLLLVDARICLDGLSALAGVIYHGIKKACEDIGEWPDIRNYQDIRDDVSKQLGLLFERPSQVISVAEKRLVDKLYFSPEED